jgi:hypothetical protein
MSSPTAITAFPARTTGEPISQRRASTPMRAAVILVPFGLTALLNAYCPSDFEPSLRLAASLTFLACWIPFVTHFFTRGSSLPLLPVLCLIYGVYFSGVIFLEDSFIVPGVNYTVPYSLLLQCESLVLAGVLCLMAGYYGTPVRIIGVLPRLRFPLDRQTGTRLGVILSFGGIVVYQLGALLPLRFQSIVTLTYQLSSFGIALLFYYQLQASLSQKMQIVLWGFLLPLRMLFAVAGGGVGSLVQDLLILLGTYWLARRKWPWRSTLVLALVVVPISGVKAEFRRAAWGSDLSTLARGQMFAALISDGFQSNEHFFRNCLQITLVRVDQLTTFCAVANLTPDVIPYWEGDSYSTIYWALIPRALYPDKPVKVIGQTFGHRYGLLGKNDRTTSYNLPQIVEMYANFGPWGVVAGMLLMGVLLRALHFVFSHPDIGEAGSLIALVTFARLCNIESDFSLIYGGIILNLVGLVVVLRILQARRVHMPLDAFRFR